MYGIGVKELKEASKNGHTFEGWYKDAAFTDRVTFIGTTDTGEITLYAKFTQKVSIIEKSEIVSLKSGTAYKLGNGTWKMSGDNTVYTGGITFYVSEDTEYEFTKQ